MIAIVPEGFEEDEVDGWLELAAYTDEAGEERLRGVFGSVRANALEAGWEDMWRRFHRPVRIGPLWVGPPWEAPPAGALAVVVDPGRAFGTGAHPTTRLCLELLLEQEPSSLLDVGCGSGVLAIAAAKLGFSPVNALDADPAAVEAARANAAANGVEVEVELGDALGGTLPTAGVAVANIALAQVEALARRLAAPRLVASGYLESDRPGLSGWAHLERRGLGGWAADLFARL